MRIATLLPLAAGLVVASCGTESHTGAPDSSFTEVPLAASGLVASQDLWDVLGPMYRPYPESLEGRQEADIALRRSEAGYVADIVKSGAMDDALFATHYRVLLLRSPDQIWFAEKVLSRHQCRRSGFGQWTTKPCL